MQVALLRKLDLTLIESWHYHIEWQSTRTLTDQCDFASAYFVFRAFVTKCTVHEREDMVVICLNKHYYSE